jgi:hypothetical protein
MSPLGFNHERWPVTLYDAPTADKNCKFMPFDIAFYRRHTNSI